MKSVLKFSFLALAVSLTASLSALALPPSHVTAPEVDPGMAITGLALLGGALAVARAKHLKK